MTKLEYNSIFLKKIGKKMNNVERKEEKNENLGEISSQKKRVGSVQIFPKSNNQMIITSQKKIIRKEFFSGKFCYFQIWGISIKKNNGILKQENLYIVFNQIKNYSPKNEKKVGLEIHKISTAFDKAVEKKEILNFLKNFEVKKYIYTASY